MRKKIRRRAARPRHRVVPEPQLQLVLQLLYRAIGTYPVGSKRHQAVINALIALNQVFKLVHELEQG